MLPKCHLEMPSSLAGCAQSFASGVASWRAFDGGLSLSTVNKKDSLVIGQWDNDTKLVISWIVTWVVCCGHCNNFIIAYFVFFMKGFYFYFKTWPHIKLSYTQASFISHKIEIIWIPILICHLHWNNHQTLPRFQAFYIASWIRVWTHKRYPILRFNGQAFVRIMEKNGRVITALHCIFVSSL